MLGGTTEDELLKWANARVPQDAQIAKFQDKSISNCKFLFQLLKSVEPKAINWELVIEEKPGHIVFLLITYIIHRSKT